MMNKFQFINNLLDKPNLNPQQEKKIIQLALKEIEKGSFVDKDLEKRVEKLEQKLSEKSSNDEGESNGSDGIGGKSNEGDDEKTNTYYPSKNLWKFLHDYNQNQILKTTCHEIDSDELKNILEFCNIEKFDFKIYKKKVQEEYRSKFLNNKKYFVHHNPKNLILSYLTGEKFNGEQSDGWTEEKIKINWNSKDLEEWCENNPNKVPHPNDGFTNHQRNDGWEFENSLNVNLIYSNQRLRYFSELILYFKHLFHIRSDNSLSNIISNINNRAKYSDKVKFIIESKSFPTDIQFFTNLEKLIQLYENILNLILKVVSEHNMELPIVELKLIETDRGVEFHIHHRNSVMKKSIRNIIDRLGGVLTNLIKYQVNGLCEFYIRADFGNKDYKGIQYAEINIWDERKNKRSAKKISPMHGVEYILKFNKT